MFAVIFRHFLLMFAVIFVLVLPLSAQAASCPAAGAVKSAADSFIGAARRGTASAFASALARHTDMNAVALFALGKYRKDLPAAKQGEYVRNARNYMGRFLAGYSDSFQVTGFRIDSCRGKLVTTSLNGQSRMTWRVADGRIEDVQVRGIWLRQQMRRKFTEIIRRADNRVEALLSFLARG